MTETAASGDYCPVENVTLSQPVGPIVFFRGLAAGRMRAIALMALPADMQAPEVVTDGVIASPYRLYATSGVVVWGYPLDLPASGGIYWVDGVAYELAGVADGDQRIGYVACNGREHGDRDRPLGERNALWARLAADHEREPFNLLLHGGDQLYADEMLNTHPALRRWQRGEVHADVDLAEVAAHLRGFLLQRYLELYSQPEPAWLLARVPSLCMWDDHDICDGWGSLYDSQLDSPVGRTVFEVARELFLVFQMGATSADRPAVCCDPTGESLTWSVELPGVSLVAPDLRSERRPNRVMGETGWRVFRQALEKARGQRVFVLSSVPALGPRMSWIEAAMTVLPGIQQYEDDLRDQWQSRSHRTEWRRFLRAVVDCHEAGRAVTLLSGEIHLATRGTMATAVGPVHQLVSSGITHPAPPRGYARILGWLARLGESPLPGHPIRLHPLPGQRTIYTPQRNYLILERRDGTWCAHWQLEVDGATPALTLAGG
jgi:hypothetical protein